MRRRQLRSALPPSCPGFTRAHLRRLIRQGKLVTTGTEGREPQVHLSDLPPQGEARGTGPPCGVAVNSGHGGRGSGHRTRAAAASEKPKGLSVKNRTADSGGTSPPTRPPICNTRPSLTCYLTACWRGRPTAMAGREGLLARAGGQAMIFPPNQTGGPESSLSTQSGTA